MPGEVVWDRMRMEENLIRLLETCSKKTPPLIAFKSKGLDAFFLRHKIEQNKFATFAVLFGLCFSLFCSVIAIPFGVKDIDLLIILLFSFAFGAGFIILSAKLLAIREEDRVKAELPFYLRDVSAMLDAGIAFDKAIWLSGKNYSIGRETNAMMERIKAKESIAIVLAEEAKRWDDEEISAVWIELSLLFRQGKGAEAIYDLAESLLEQRKLSIKASVSKIAFSSLIFITFTVLIPLFLVILYEVGDGLLNMNITKEMFSFILLIIIPMLAYIALLVMYFTSPFIYPSKSLPSNLIFLLPGVLSAIAFIVGLPKEVLLMVGIGAFLVISIKEFKKIRKELEKEKMEKELNALCIGISSFPSSRGSAELLGEMAKRAKTKLGPMFFSLSEAIRKGVPVRKVLQEMRKEQGMMQRLADVLLYCELYGKDMSYAMYELVKDGMAVEELKKEKSAALAMQRITIIGSLFLLPVAMAFSSMISNTLAEIFPGIKSVEDVEVSVMIFLYLISVLSGECIGNIDGSYTNKILYMIGLFGLAIIGWHLGLGMARI